VVRVVSDQSVTVWVNGRRAAVLSPEQFPWAATPESPWQAQLFSAPVTQSADESGNEIVLAARAESGWPRVAPQLLFVPQPTGTIRLQAREAAGLEGGVQFVGGTEAFPQPHIGLDSGLDSGADGGSGGGGAAEGSEESTPAQPASAAPPRAVYRFRVEAPGFYRLRLWCYWRTADAPGLLLALDGTVAESAFGRGSAVLRRWHWILAGVAADLGTGEHTLEIGGWKPGALAGIMEIVPALLPPA